MEAATLQDSSSSRSGGCVQLHAPHKTDTDTSSDQRPQTDVNVQARHRQHDRSSQTTNKQMQHCCKPGNRARNRNLTVGTQSTSQNHTHNIARYKNSCSAVLVQLSAVLKAQLCSQRAVKHPAMRSTDICWHACMHAQRRRRKVCCAMYASNL
jgi:hypothetical protein